MSTDFETISLHSDDDRKKLRGFIDECVLVKQKIKMEQETLKDIRSEAKDNLGIPPKIFNKLVKVAFNDSFQTEKQEYEEFEAIVDLLFTK
jgi:uncharacterized protein (UPF0335 family)